MPSASRLEDSRIVFLPEVDDLGSGKSGKIRVLLQERFGNGFYRFGEKLSATDLAKEFGVSRQPVMMALRELRGDGFVIITPQVGCETSSPDTAEISDFFSVFAKMEGRMAGLAAERRDDGELEQLRGIQAAMEQSLAMPGHQNLDNVNYFHGVVRQMAKSAVMANRIAKFWYMANYILRNGTRDYTDKIRAVSVGERREIVAAIGDQDVGAAERLMEQHVLGKPKRVNLV